MTDSGTAEKSLEDQLEMLRSANSTASAQHIHNGIIKQTRLQRRQVILASLGACIAAIATLHFVLQADPVGYFALLPVTVVFVFIAWRSARQASQLATLKSGVSLLASWRLELRRQLRHTLLAPALAVAFAAMTACVVWQNGLPSMKSSLFLIAATGVLVFAAHQLFVRRPSLTRELEMLATHE